MSESVHAKLNLLLALADDELVIGHRHSEWTGWGPTVEADLAFSSIAQDEMAHAQVLYQLITALDGRQPDELALGRHRSEYRHCVLTERPNSGPRSVAPEFGDGPGLHDLQGPLGNWAYSLARQFLYDTADDLRTETLLDSSFSELAAAVGIIRLEEAYHLEHCRLWVRRLTEHSADGRARMQQGFEAAAADAASVFEPVWDEELLVTDGVLPTSFVDLEAIWREQVSSELASLGITDLKFDNSAPGGRTGSHTQDFDGIWDEMTALYREHAGASW